MKRQICIHTLSLNLSILRYLCISFVESRCFLKVIFLKAWFWSCRILLMFYAFVWPHSCASWCKCDSTRVWYTIFKMLRFALCLNLLRTSIPWFVLQWQDLIVYSNKEFHQTCRKWYFTIECKFVTEFYCRNIILPKYYFSHGLFLLSKYYFSLFNVKESLLAFNHWERCLRSGFTLFAKICRDQNERYVGSIASCVK